MRINLLKKFVLLYLLLNLVIVSAVSYKNLCSKQSKLGSAVQTVVLPEKNTGSDSEPGFTLLDTSGGRILKLSEEEFLIGNLSCELSPETPTEALKAQAVASLSFFSYKKEHPESDEYNFTCDIASSFVYIDEEKRQQLWGESFESYNNKIYDAIESVKGQRLVYCGSVACASFFSVSSGITGSASELWGEDFPYLSSVASPYDSFAPDFERSYSFTAEEVRAVCKKTWPEARFNFKAERAQWFTELSYRAGGGVASVNICGFSVTGLEFMDAFGLASPTFTVEADGDGFVMRSKGSGSGIGMSQYGAVSMAQGGASYREILAYYYPGTELFT